MAAGQHPSQGVAAAAVKVALFEAAKAAVPWSEGVHMLDGEPVDVAFGFRWPALFPDHVAVTAVRTAPADPATLGPSRTRQIDVEVDLTVVSFRVTADEQLVSDRAYAVLGAIDEYMRGPGITLGGAALWCLLTSTDSDGATSDEDAGEGRITEIAATYTARVVITSRT